MNEQIEKRTSKKSDDQKAVRKQISMRKESWIKADNIADREGKTRSAIIAEAIEILWKERNDDNNV